MGDELVHAYRAAAADQSLRAVILTGSGRAFCAGADRAFLAGEKARSGKRLGEENSSAGLPRSSPLPFLSIARSTAWRLSINVTTAQRWICA
jgi:enoyl-CoA hydratase/carnithine racemase